MLPVDLFTNPETGQLNTRALVAFLSGIGVGAMGLALIAGYMGGGANVIILREGQKAVPQGAVVLEADERAVPMNAVVLKDDEKAVPKNAVVLKDGEVDVGDPHELVIATLKNDLAEAIEQVKHHPQGASVPEVTRPYLAGYMLVKNTPSLKLDDESENKMVHTHVKTIGRGMIRQQTDGGGFKSISANDEPLNMQDQLIRVDSQNNEDSFAFVALWSTNQSVD